MNISILKVSKLIEVDKELRLAICSEIYQMPEKNPLVLQPVVIINKNVATPLIMNNCC